MLNKFKTGRIVIERMVDIVKGYLEKDKEMDNRKKLYVFYDSILLNLFDSLEDLKKTSVQIYNSDFDTQNERSEIFKLIHRVIEMLESSLEDHTYLNSFLERTSSKYLGLDTFSFVMSEFKLSDYDKTSGFSVHNPNIDTSFNIIQHNNVFLEFEPRINIKDISSNIQVLSLSAPLMENKFSEYGDIPVSNVIYNKYIDPKSPHKLLFHRDVGTKLIRIDFAMIFTPSFENILDNVFCKAYYSGSDKGNKTGKAVRFDDDKMIVTCEFSAEVEFQNYYFALTLRK